MAVLISKLMAEPPKIASDRKPWLVSALQAAIKLEFSTVPPYLFALWSIIDETDFTARSIREIVHEEMVHMGLACNMLAAIGVSPQFTGPDFLPSYPSELPGDVKPGVTLKLVGLTRESLKTLREVEAPEDEEQIKQSETYSSVAAFYKAILRIFEELSPNLDTSYQIAGPLSPMTVSSLSDVKNAIELILTQGEGGEGTPEELPGDLAHFFRLEEILNGRKLVETKPGKWECVGDEIPWPEAFIVNEVPSGGYKESDVTIEVWQQMTAFDKKYSTVLRLLETAWKKGDQGPLIKAIYEMFSMREIARTLMRIPVDGDVASSYGPNFGYVDEGTV